MPPRLQAPLWRSPSKSEPPSSQEYEHEQRVCNHRGGSSPGPSKKSNKQEIQAHQNGISRHRAKWDRPKTPPGYWDIAFPNTQRVEEVNRVRVFVFLFPAVRLLIGHRI